MEPSLLNGEKVLVFKAAYGIKSPFRNKYFIRWTKPCLNDIVMFKIHGRSVVKRCKGIEGTPVLFKTVSGDDGLNEYFMTVNGSSFSLTPAEFRNLGGMSGKPAYVIGKNNLLLLGDNQKYSEDSKNYGFVSVDSICGKVLIKF